MELQTHHVNAEIGDKYEAVNHPQVYLDDVERLERLVANSDSPFLPVRIAGFQLCGARYGMDCLPEYPQQHSINRLDSEAPMHFLAKGEKREGSDVVIFVDKFAYNFRVHTRVVRYRMSDRNGAVVTLYQNGDVNSDEYLNWYCPFGPLTMRFRSAARYIRIMRMLIDIHYEWTSRVEGDKFNVALIRDLMHHSMKLIEVDKKVRVPYDMTPTLKQALERKARVAMPSASRATTGSTVWDFVNQSDPKQVVESKKFNLAETVHGLGIMFFFAFLFLPPFLKVTQFCVQPGSASNIYCATMPDFDNFTAVIFFYLAYMVILMIAFLLFFTAYHLIVVAVTSLAQGVRFVFGSIQKMVMKIYYICSFFWHIDREFHFRRTQLAVNEQALIEMARTVKPQPIKGAEIPEKILGLVPDFTTNEKIPLFNSFIRNTIDDIWTNGTIGFAVTDDRQSVSFLATYHQYANFKKIGGAWTVKVRAGNQNGKYFDLAEYVDFNITSKLLPSFDQVTFPVKPGKLSTLLSLLCIRETDLPSIAPGMVKRWGERAFHAKLRDDKIVMSNPVLCQYNYSNQGDVQRSAGTVKFMHTGDTQDGDSGSWILQRGPNRKYIIIGIHAAGGATPPNKDLNIAYSLFFMRARNFHKSLEQASKLPETEVKEARPEYVKWIRDEYNFYISRYEWNLMSKEEKREFMAELEMNEEDSDDLFIPNQYSDEDEGGWKGRHQGHVLETKPKVLLPPVLDVTRFPAPSQLPADVAKTLQRGKKKVGNTRKPIPVAQKPKEKEEVEPSLVSTNSSPAGDRPSVISNSPKRETLEPQIKELDLLTMAQQLSQMGLSISALASQTPPEVPPSNAKKRRNSKKQKKALASQASSGSASSLETLCASLSTLQRELALLKRVSATKQLVQSEAENAQTASKK